LPVCVDYDSGARKGKRPIEPIKISHKVKFAGGTTTPPDNPRRERRMDKLNKSFFSPTTPHGGLHKKINGKLKPETKGKEPKNIGGTG
jgi:hypothetical protein